MSEQEPNLHFLTWLDQLKTLPANYRLAAVGASALWEDITGSAIKEEVLSETYKLPDVLPSYLQTHLEQLAPTYELFAQRDWQPEVVLIPKGLTQYKWDALLSNKNIVPNGPSSIMYDWPSEVHGLIDPTSDNSIDKNPPAHKWDVAIVSGTNQPVFMDIGLDEVTGSLAELPHGDGSSSEFVKQVCPSQATYFALQLGRLTQGGPMIDALSWTIMKEDIMVSHRKRSLFWGWDAGYLISHWHDPDIVYSRGGVRPSVNAEALRSTEPDQA